MIEGQSNTHQYELLIRLFNKVTNHLLKHPDNIECHFYLFYAEKVLLEGRNFKMTDFSRDENKYPIKKQGIGILVWI